MSSNGKRVKVTNGYRAIFFDAGNTLLMPHPSVEEVCAELLERHGIPADMESIRRGTALANRHYEKRYWSDDTFWASEEQAQGLWLEMYGLLMREVGFEADSSEMGELLYAEFGEGHRWTTFPEVLATLGALHERGLILGIVSNWDVRLPEICHQLGISDYLDFIISSATVGRIKPEPAIFQMALDRAGVTPEQAVHVGDHFYADVLGARSAGIKPVLVDRHGYAPSGDCAIVASLDELIPLLGL